jgi:uncharacterized protein
MIMQRRSTFIALVVFLAGTFGITAQERYDVSEHYTKREYSIPMRDGVKLFTVVYTPVDTARSYPILMMRTPYGVGPYCADEYKSNLGPSDVTMREGYIFVYQDVRGKMMSGGEYVNIRPTIPAKLTPADIDESSDTYDSIDWLVKHIAHTNGRAGLYGISYPGFYAALGLIDAHPALKAVSPQAPIDDWFIGDDFHHNGALFLLDAFSFMSGFGQHRSAPEKIPAKGYAFETPDPYRFFLNLGAIANIDRLIFKQTIGFWDDMVAHGTYDKFWKDRNVADHLTNVKPAVMTVGGLFDAEDFYGPLHIYHAIEQTSPGAFNVLVVGPWFHGGWSRSAGDELGNIGFGSKTSEYYRDSIEAVFFRSYLKGEAKPELSEALVFQTGSNKWKRYAQWPPAQLQQKKFYFHANGKLSFLPPDSAAPFDEYVSDPNRPVPYTNGIHVRRNREFMTEDQRFAFYRPDVISYETRVLDEDVTCTGPVTVNLNVSTTGTDADFIVKLIDVLPDDARSSAAHQDNTPMGGYQFPVRMDVMRGKFRNSFEKPEPFTPNAVTQVRFTLNDINHCFRAGHKMMVQVQSSWFPLVDRNPQMFVDIYHATDADYQKATHRIYHTPVAPSYVEIGIAR